MLLTRSLNTKIITTVAILLFAVSGMFFRCSSDAGDQFSTNIDGNIVTLTTASAGQVSFVLNSPSSWSIAAAHPWITFSKSSGEGGSSIVMFMYYTANPDTEPRSTTFTITNADGESLNYTVEQPARSDNQGNHNYSWLELPEIKESSAEMFVTHFVTLKGNNARNYSMLYNSDNLAATWVAYPLHNVYFGTSGRSNEWGWDPKVPRSLQTALFRGFGSGYDRGHQIASADRTATEEMNIQTFFFTNMTPQLNSLNAYEWASLETWMRNNAKADTLYVVTGAVYQTVGGNEHVQFITNNNDNKRVPVPNYYYKVALKRKGNTSYTAIGFWYEHKAANGSITANKAVTVRNIEEKTGVNFFVNIPQDIQDEAEAKVTASDWKF